MGQKEGKVKSLTAIALFTSILGVLCSLVPFFGAVAVIIGLVGIILNIYAYYRRNKQALKNILPIVGLIFGVIAFSLGFSNYLNHKNAVDLILGVPGAKSKLLLVPEDSPLREIVEIGSGYTEAEISQRKSENSKLKAAEQNEEKDPEVSPVEPAKIDEPASEDSKNTMHYKKTSGPLNSYYYSIVDKLRIRSKPEIGSEVVGHLEFGEQVRYRGEQSDEKEVIELAGKQRNDYWYKVTTLVNEDVSGWVYGGALLNASESSSDKLPNKILKPFNFISSDSISSLIGRSSYGNYTYSGLMTFSETDSGNLILNGRFYFIGFSSYDFGEIPGYGEDEELRGETKDGKLDGDFVNLVGLFESWLELKIKFKEGVCLSYKLIENQEGEISESKSSNPTDCSFEYIQDNLKEVN